MPPTAALSAAHRRPLASVRTIETVVHYFTESGPVFVFLSLFVGNFFCQFWVKKSFTLPQVSNLNFFVKTQHI